MKRTPEEWAAIDARVAASRARQGLPPKITDPAILDQVAAVFLAAGPERPASRPRRSDTVRQARRRAVLHGLVDVDAAGAGDP